MKKIFECSEGIEFFSNGESILGVLSKEEALKFITETARIAVEVEDYQDFDVLLKLLAEIRMSYIQIPASEVEITIIIQ